MKKITLLLCLLTPFIVNAQISIKEDVKNSPVLKPKNYDSLSNFKYEYDESYSNYNQSTTKDESIDKSDHELLQYIGQTIYFVPCPKCEDADAFEKLSFHYIHNSSSEGFRGKYFKIFNFEFDDKNKPYGGTIKMYLLDQNKDSLYVQATRQEWHWGRIQEFIILGYYEKQKQKHVGKSFLAQNIYGNAIPETFDINTGQAIKILHGDEWLCKSLDYLNTGLSYYQLFLTFSNNSGAEIKVRIRKIKGDASSILDMDNFIDKEKYLKEQELAKLSLEEKKKKEQESTYNHQLERKKWETNILSKYGDNYGNLIIANKVVLGMTQEMCAAAWGQPYDKNITIVSGLTHEQWVYSYKTYLYFDNGKLTGIQK